MKNNTLIIFCLIVIFLSAFIEYYVFTQHLQISLYKKINYTIIDLIHNFFYIIIILLLFNFNCNIQKLILLNTLILLLVCLFFYYKRCILSILGDNISGINKFWTSIHMRFLYIFGFNKNYIPLSNESYLIKWINGNSTLVFLTLLLNIFFLFNSKCYLKK